MPVSHSVWQMFCLPDFVFPHRHLLTSIQTKSTRTWAQPFSSSHRKSNYLRMSSFLQSLLKILWNHTERLHHIWFNITVLQSPDLPWVGSILLTPRLTPTDSSIWHHLLPSSGFHSSSPIPFSGKIHYAPSPTPTPRKPECPWKLILVSSLKSRCECTLYASYELGFYITDSHCVKIR